MLKKNLPIGIQTFSEIIQDGYVYIDKTAYIHTLITTGKCYFLARPRRFGKSLLVSTLSEIFSGNKERFTGLAIESLPYDWKKYPVISISFSDIDCTNPENLTISLKRYLQRIAKQYQINLETVNTPGAMLQDLVEILADQNPVVLLIDEYDYAILKHIHKPEMANEMRETIKNFYAVIKGLDKYLKFIFLTGVSKFSKTSIFSGLNNLNDIGLDNTYNLLLGYTKDEIIQYFEPYLLEASVYNKYPM
ncbi:MAG TPA: AAA family ATPase, partial [Aquella sp.]|nr:AAA family ATPase [Aquella sp.]